MHFIFFKLCLDEYLYDTPYLQHCTGKKMFLVIFFLREFFSAAPSIIVCRSMQLGLHLLPQLFSVNSSGCLHYPPLPASSAAPSQLLSVQSCCHLNHLKPPPSSITAAFHYIIGTLEKTTPK